MAYRIAVAVSGRGSNLRALLDALPVDTSASVVRVLADRPAPALDLAHSRGIATHCFLDPADPAEWSRQLEEAGADLLLLAGYLRLVPAATVAAFAGRIVNIHPALLPRYGGRGMYGLRVHQAVHTAGDPESGATVHLVDEVYDRGAILGQARVPVLPGDTAESLAARVLTVEHQLLPAAVLAAARAGHPVPFQLD